MRKRNWRPSAVAMAIAVLGAAVVVAPGAAAAPPPKIGVCQHRLCLVKLQATVDTDGDGFTDQDEVAFGTDPKDPESHPPVVKFFDDLLNGKVPSFQSHFTEIVVLPQLTPDGEALATGLGEFKLEDRDLKLFPNLHKGIQELVDKGFDLRFGFRASLPGGKLELPDAPLLLGPAADMALVSSTTGVCCGPATAPNQGKDTEGTLGGLGPRSAEERGQEFVNDLSNTHHRYSVFYTDGSRDDVVETQHYTGQSGSTTVHSYDANGNRISTSSEYMKTGTDQNGNPTTTWIGTTTWYDADGNATNSVSVTRVQTQKDDTTTVTETVTHRDGHGRVTAEGTKEYTYTCPASKLGCEGGVPEDKYVDPDYIGPGPLTEADMDRVKWRLEAVRTPGPDHGDLPEKPDTPPDGDPRHPDPWVVLVDPDGVTTIATNANPIINKVQPDYDPTLAELSQLTNVPFPPTRGGEDD